VKHRIGVDDLDSYDALKEFVRIVSLAGCDRFIIHSRKALLQGLSPKENRSIPRLDYSMASRIKEEFPHLLIDINGEIKTIEDMKKHLDNGLDGVMIGRAANDNPFLLALVDRTIYGEEKPNAITREQVIESMLPYVAAADANGEKPYRILRHMLNLYAGVPGHKKQWKKYITEHAGTTASGTDVLLRALTNFQQHKEFRGHKRVVKEEYNFV